MQFIMIKEKDNFNCFDISKIDYIIMIYYNIINSFL